MGVEACEGTAGDVADDVSAGAFGGEADFGELVDDFHEGFEGEPMQLDVLAGGDIGEVPGVLLRDVADGAELVRGEQAVGKADAHHEELGGLALAADATGGADAIALGVDAPPLEVEAGPLGEDGGAALSGEVADLVPGFPGVFLELETLGSLGLGFLERLGGWERCGRDVRHEGRCSLDVGEKKGPREGWARSALPGRSLSEQERAAHWDRTTEEGQGRAGECSRHGVKPTFGGEGRQGREGRDARAGLKR